MRFPFDFLSQVQEEQKDKHQKQKVTLIEMRREDIRDKNRDG